MKRPKASVFVQAIVFWMIEKNIKEGRRGTYNVSEIAEQFGVARSTVIQWVLRYDARLGLRAWRNDEDGRGTYEVYFSDYVMRGDLWLEYEQAHHEVNAYILWKKLR